MLQNSFLSQMRPFVCKSEILNAGDQFSVNSGGKANSLRTGELFLWIQIFFDI